MRLKPLSVEDAALVAPLEVAAFGDEAWDEPALRAQLQRGLGLLAFLGSRGEPAGYALGWALAGEAKLLRIGVAPAFRRQGLGEQLIRAFGEACKGAGAERIFLEVRAGNTPAIGLYRQAGYTGLGRRRRYYRDGEDALLFELPLKADRA